MNMNYEWTQIDTRTDGPPSTTTGANMLLHFCPVGVTLSWEEAHPGARASRPHKSSRSFGHLLHRNQPAAAPCLCFGRAHAVPAGRAVGCNIAGKLSGNRRDSMRAGRPRSRGCRPDGEVGGIRRATSQKADLHPLGNSRLPASRVPAPHDGTDHPRVKQVLFQVSPAPATTTVRITQRKNGRSLMKTNHEWTRINTNRQEDRWTCFNHKRRQNASAILCPWCDHVMGGSPPGSAGVPPAQILPQLQPSPPPESTGSGALPLLRPGPCGSRRQGGRLQHRRETERQPKGQHAGGTPALPGDAVPAVRWRCLAGDFSESRRAPFGKLPFAREPGPRLPRLDGSSESETGFVSGFRQVPPPPPRRCASLRGKTAVRQ